MAFLISSLAQRLKIRHRNKRITSSSNIRRPSLFSCGGGGSGDTFSPFVKPKTSRKPKGPSGSVEHGNDSRKADVDEPCVWRRTILLGQRCQPLEFNGAIHYDSEGQRLWHSRTPPRSPLLSPVRSLEFGYMDRA
ncbi:uncharacterized protein LOC104583308 [Brachypodium distachyon]|nr:uncharacterized protein LOC104583308 [Brachypodium distachyon]|eukprot:XP_010233473.1 uncharacterized protein LOC104583308 [Brachypodium distachyon]